MGNTTDKALADALFPQKQFVEKVTSYNVNNTQLAESVLNRQQQDEFYDLVRDYTVLQKMIAHESVNHPSGEIVRLNQTSYVTEGAASGVTAFTTSAPTDDNVTYDTVKYRAGFNLYSDWLEDNIEREGARETLMRHWMKCIANDMEYASINSDSTLTTGDAQSRSNNLLGVNDGFKKLLADNVPAGQQLSCAGAGVSKDVFYDMIQLIPAKYRTSMPDYRFLVSPYVWNRWLYDFAARATLGGDDALTGGSSSKFAPFGIPMVMVPHMPENLTYGTAVTDATQIWLTPLANLYQVEQRKVTIEWERVPREDLWKCTLHYRIDWLVPEPEMVIIAKDLSKTGTAYAT